MYAALPGSIQQAAIAAFAMFLLNPDHPGLRRHSLKTTRKGQHQPGSFSVRVTFGYRAIYFTNNGVNVWYWIGSHADYDAFTGRI